MRAYGELLGLCKKAVEACLAEGREGSLRQMIQAFVLGGSGSQGDSGSGEDSVGNPPRAKHKGRPKGAANKGSENQAPQQLTSSHLSLVRLSALLLLVPSAESSQPGSESAACASKSATTGGTALSVSCCLNPTLTPVGKNLEKRHTCVSTQSV